MTRAPTIAVLLTLSAVLGFTQAEALPLGFRSLRLGAPIEEVKLELAADTTFAYRGDPDVSLLPLDQQQIIETEGRRFIRRAFFQFFEDRLYTITLRLDESELDFYTMYTALTEKYGEPTALDPQEVVWESEDVRFSLERPLTVKYVDLPVFNRRIAEQREGESMDEFTRQQFIDQF